MRWCDLVCVYYLPRYLLQVFLPQLHSHDASFGWWVTLSTRRTTTAGTAFYTALPALVTDGVWRRFDVNTGDVSWRLLVVPTTTLLGL